MEDSEIVELYWQRAEDAVSETDRKYGAYCRRIALDLLSVREDAEECVSDAYYQAWSSIPPQRPVKLKSWLGRVVRNLSINRWHKNHARKRYGGLEGLLSELEDCLPAPQSTEQEVDDAELGACIDRWLLSLPQADRVLFVQRYWYGTPLCDLAKRRRIPPGKLAQKMYRLRISLKAELEKEEISL